MRLGPKGPLSGVLHPPEIKSGYGPGQMTHCDRVRQLLFKHEFCDLHGMAQLRTSSVFQSCHFNFADFRPFQMQFSLPEKWPGTEK